MITKILNGLALDDTAFTLDAYRQTGNGEHFLGTAHTLATTMVFVTSLRRPTAVLSSNGHRTGRRMPRSSALELWQKQLPEYQALPTDQGIDEALLSFVAEGKASMDDR